VINSTPNAAWPNRPAAFNRGASEQNLVVADGLIFALTKKNELVMAEAGREGYRELGRVALGIELGRPQQPTIANGRMYIRGDTTVICFKVVP
jgi:hypothetical protein